MKKRAAILIVRRPWPIGAALVHGLPLGLKGFSQHGCDKRYRRIGLNYAQSLPPMNSLPMQ
ncbi:putative lipoprotein [Pseudomonas chlororaphis subsp. piscium]|nr:putative lipoprotein [Pseudomonas chlororaphis subsp. piscium]